MNTFMYIKTFLSSSPPPWNTTSLHKVGKDRLRLLVLESSYFFEGLSLGGYHLRAVTKQERRLIERIQYYMSFSPTPTLTCTVVSHVDTEVLQFVIFLSSFIYTLPVPHIHTHIPLTYLLTSTSIHVHPVVVVVVAAAFQ